MKNIITQYNDLTLGLDRLSEMIKTREDEVVEFAKTIPSDHPQRERANQLSYTYWEARSSIRKLVREIQKAIIQEEAL